MRARCPSAVKEGRAYLPAHRLAFGGHSTGWGGAVATIVRMRGARVPGVMYRITEEDFAVLDIHEGTYERRRVRLIDDAGRTRSAESYILDIAFESTPSLAYLAAIARGYRALGYDGSALDEIAMRTA